MIFNWNKKESTDKELTSDHERTSFDDLLNSFESSKWASMSNDQRVAILQEIENRHAAQQSRQPAQISAVENDYYGAFNSISNKILIRFSGCSSYDVLDTYVHESNHAYQTHCIKTGLDQGSGYDEYARCMMQAEMARDANGAMYNYADSYPLYDMQYDELDSNNKAMQFMLSQQDRFGADPDYLSYLEERERHFSAVNQTLSDLREMRASFQHDQAYSSFVRGDINSHQYEIIENHIKDPKTIDSAEQKSAVIEERIRSLSNSIRADYGRARTDNGFEQRNNHVGKNSSITDMSQSGSMVEDYYEASHILGGNGISHIESLSSRYEQGVQSLREAFPEYQTDPIQKAVYAQEIQNMERELGYAPHSQHYSEGQSPSLDSREDMSNASANDWNNNSKDNAITKATPHKVNQDLNRENSISKATMSVPPNEQKGNAISMANTTPAHDGQTQEGSDRAHSPDNSISR